MAYPDIEQVFHQLIIGIERNKHRIGNENIIIQYVHKEEQTNARELPDTSQIY